MCLPKSVPNCPITDINLVTVSSNRSVPNAPLNNPLGGIQIYPLTYLFWGTAGARPIG
jgi:hypothetical protein